MNTQPDMQQNVENLIQFICGRRSIRAFCQGEVTEQTVKRLLETAMAAPSAVAKDPWRFVVVRKPEMLKKIADGLPNGKMLAQASVGIVVCGDIGAAHDGQLSYLLQDCSAAIENLLLAAHAFGLGTCWLGVHPREQRAEYVRGLLEIPANVIPVAVVAVGIPAEAKGPRTRYNPAFVHQEKW